MRCRMVDESDKSGLARRIQMRRIDRSMDKASADNKKRQKEYGEIIVNHLRDNGPLVCLSDDRAFTETLRDVVVNTLKMPAATLNISTKVDLAARFARQAVEDNKTPLFLIEQNLNGRDLTFIGRVLKNAFSELNILMLVKETDKHRFVLLHESGVDDFIVKPQDNAGLMEKIALTIQPNDQVERTIKWINALLKKGEYLPALQTCSQALEQQGNSPAILLLMGDIFKAMHEYEKAADAYNKASAGSSLFLEPLHKLADLYGEMGNTARQISYLEKMDEVSPLNLDRKLQIGELLLKLKQPDKARKMFDQAMKLSNRQARENVAGVAYRVADLYVQTDPMMAAEFLRKGLEARKDFWGHEDLATFNRLGLLLRREGRWREATDEYRKALMVAPNDETLHYNLCVAFLEGKEIEPARASALKALAINPELPRKSTNIATNLAMVFLGSNDKMHALPLLRTALELDPENEQARELMATLDAESGN